MRANVIARREVSSIRWRLHTRVTSSRLRGAWGLLGALVLAVVVPVNAMAASIASSPFTGIEDPLSENGAWVPLTSPGLCANGGRLQQNDGGLLDKAAPDPAS